MTQSIFHTRKKPSALILYPPTPFIKNFRVWRKNYTAGAWQRVSAKFLISSLLKSDFQRSTLNVQLLRTNELLIVFNDETPWTRITKNWCFPEFIILYDISFPLKLLYGGNRERFIFYDTHIVKSSLRVSMFYVSPRTDWKKIQARFSRYRHFIITQNVLTLATRSLEVITFCG